MNPGTLIRPVLLLGLTLFIAPHPCALPHPKERWIRADTPRFSLLTNVREAKAADVATDLEELFSALKRTLGREDLGSGVRTTVFVFRSSASFESYKPLYDGRPAAVSGYFLPHAFGNFVAVDGDPKLDTRRIVYHEYLHYVLDHNFPNLPLWLNEGLAEYFSTFQVFKDEALVAIPIEPHVRWLKRGKLMPLDELFSVERDDAAYNERKRKGAFYAQSWALVHALFTADRERREQGPVLLERLDAGAGVVTALRGVYGLGLEELEREHQGYARAPQLRWTRLEIEPPASKQTLAGRPVPRHEVLYHLGRLLSASERLTEAEEHFEAALGENPQHGPSHAGRGLLEELRGRTREATVHYEQALRTSDDPFVLHLSAQNLLRPLAGRAFRPGMLDADTRNRVDRARDAYRRCLELDPGFAEARAGLGATYLFEAKVPEEGLDAMETAHRWKPQRVDIAFNLALLAAHAGRRERAHEVIEGVLVRLAEPRQVETARDALLEADFRAAGELDAAERIKEAVEVFEKALARTTGADRRRRLEERIAELEAVLERRSRRSRSTEGTLQ